MPIYDFCCSECDEVTEHLFTRFADAKASILKCAKEDCDGDVAKAAISRGRGPQYAPTIERYMELERGHLPTFQPPPMQHSKSGAGIRRYPGHKADR